MCTVTSGLSLLLIPAYTTLRGPSTLRFIKTCPDDALLRTASSLDSWTWRQCDSDQHYPGFPKPKTWMMRKVQALLRGTALCIARANLRRGHQTGRGGLQGEDRGLLHRQPPPGLTGIQALSTFQAQCPPTPDSSRGAHLLLSLV